MSDGCVAMQMLACAEDRVYAIAAFDAAQPVPGSRLLHGVAVS